MRLNVYTEELLMGKPGEPPLAEIVHAKYVNSRTGKEMYNYGLRVYVRSTPELHYIPGRDDDRSAVTFWCGEKESNVFAFIDLVRGSAYASTLDTWREKVGLQQADAERQMLTPDSLGG